VFRLGLAMVPDFTMIIGFGAPSCLALARRQFHHGDRELEHHDDPGLR
jgi:hypothetical protein